MKDGLIGQVAAMQEFFDRSTRSLDEGDASFRPQEDLFTTAQVVAHVAQTVHWFIDGAFASNGFDMDFERMDQEVRAVNSLATARQQFADACNAAKSAIEAHSEQDWATPLPPGPIMGGQPRFVIFGALTDHTAHHRGALTVYARLRGKVPPMPYMDM